MTALIFALIKENFVAEQGARMVSMDGASKNAGDMIDKLNLSFNRMRQAVWIFILNFSFKHYLRSSPPNCPRSSPVWSPSSKHSIWLLLQKNFIY